MKGILRILRRHLSSFVGTYHNDGMHGQRVPPAEERITGLSQGAILAAGGIVVRHGADGNKIAIVQRRRYRGEMGLPKGKIKEGESIVEAAQREIWEETGCEVKNPKFAGAIHYLVNDVPKVVFFYVMELVREDPAGPKDTREIKTVKWMSPAEAVKELTHVENRKLIADIFGFLPPQSQRMDIRTRVIRMWWGAFGSPERDRLAATIAETRIELDRHTRYLDKGTTTTPWTQAANRHILQAENCLQSCNIQGGWVAIQSAQRAALVASDDYERAKRVADALRSELAEKEKITGWRAKAASELINDKDGKPESIRSKADVLRVADALWLRDEQFNTTYHRIVLRRRHLQSLFVLLSLAIVFCFWRWPHALLPEGPHRRWGILATTILFGILGAGVSVAQGLLTAGVTAKIPAQQIGSFLAWMRPAIGAVAAMAAIVFLKAGIAIKIFSDDLLNKHPAAIFAVAFIAGFSERFITGAIERISEPSKEG